MLIIVHQHPRMLLMVSTSFGTPARNLVLIDSYNLKSANAFQIFISTFAPLILQIGN